MPLEELSTTKAHFYDLFESLSFENFQVTKFPEFQKGLFLEAVILTTLFFLLRHAEGAQIPI